MKEKKTRHEEHLNFLRYWKGRTPRLWQVGRAIRLIVGFILIVVSILGD
ncbi:MAG: hypothetical protein ABR962_07140 [Candidatus Bathyarchaeia archaeon]